MIQKSYETTSTGVEVTGNINAVEGVFTGDVLVSKDSPSLTLKNTTNEHTDEGAESKIVFKDHADNSLGKIEVSHNGNNDNALGNMYLQTGNGSTVVTALELNSSQNATFAGNVTLSSTAPILYLTNTTSSTGKTWRFSSAANGNAYITQDGVIDAITLSHTSGNATFAGTVYIPSKLEHTGDSDTFLNFSDDTITLSAGGSSTTFAGNGNAAFAGNINAVEGVFTGDVNIQGDLTVNGTYTQIDTDVSTTEQWLVTNDGTGPAAIINQIGAQDIIDIQDDGTSVFYIEDGGNVGIGTTNPGAKLSVLGTSSITGSLTLGTTAGSNLNMLRTSANYINATNATGYLVFRTGGYDTALTLDSSQNATFAGDVYIPEYIYHSGDTNTYIRFTDDTQTFRTGGDDRLILTNTTATFSGDVSASNLSGTNTGDQDLSGYALTSAIPTDFVSAASGGTFAGTVDFSSDLNIDNALDVGGLATFNDQTSFYDDITTNGGSIGIDISPSYRLDVNGMIALSGTAIADLGTNLIKIGDVDGNGAELALYDETPAEVVRIKDGKVGINDTTPSHNLDVTGDGRFTSTVTATNFILSSDSRLKENVEEVDNKSIDVDWKTFEMKSNKGQKRYGVIAQELEEVHPEFVRTDDEGMKSVAYVDLLIAKIAELEARLEKLEK